MEPMTSQYGTLIDLAQIAPTLAGQPLNINGTETLALDPDRYKQHGFHFNADNCIGCHACESACSEKNALPAHLVYRRVGSIEGGTYPDVVRINITMACNHCEDPVCLKGCPTRAYTKYAEYGAVLQDPEICFGCGYCTWVCPYNAPQLDPVQGHVEKCNMCVDRLESGLQPACVSACLSNALDFGIIESIPMASEQATLTLPGFPDPSITRPNIRFHQTRTLPSEFTRGDSAPVRYYKDAPNQSSYKTGTTTHHSEPKRWGNLSSREDPLVYFTLVSQMVVGAVFSMALFLKEGEPGVFQGALLALLGTLFSGLATSTMHLGKPRYFYRAMYNLRHSWVSREILTMGTFFHMLGAMAMLGIFPGLFSFLPDWVPRLLGHGTWAMGILSLYCMAKCYRIPARPFWNHWQTQAAFYSSALILGPLFVGTIFGLAGALLGRPIGSLLSGLSLPLIVGLMLQGVSLLVHLRDLSKRTDEATVSMALMRVDYGKTYLARYASLALLLAFAIGISGAGVEGLDALSNGWALGIWGFMFLLALIHEAAGRALFYVVVTPTTHPGSFFFGNKAFETHARQSGLASMPQTGVHPKDH
jgi:DMSO reductase iron-sulfur subunit